MTPFNRRLLYFVLLYTSVEGLVINMTFPSKLGYIVKDIVLVLAATTLLLDNNGRRFGSLGRLTLPLMLFAFVQMSYLLLPIGELPLLARLVGLKMRLLYILTMLLAYRFIRSTDDVYRVVFVLAISAIPVALFGVYLFFAGPDALRRIGGTYSAVVTSTTGFWRVPGTFNSPGQFGLYLLFNAQVTLGLLLMPNLQTRVRGILWASLAVVILATLVSGSRTPLVLMVAGTAIVLVGTGRTGRIVTIGATAYMVLALGFTLFGGGVADRVGSIVSVEHIQRFNQTYFGQLFLPRVFETPMGIGLGAATIGARHFSEFHEVLLVESYFGVVAIETGFLGLLTILMVSAAALAYLFRARLLMRNAVAGPVWFAFAAFATIVLLLGPVSTPLDVAPGNVYFWFSLGVAAKLYDLEREARAAALPDTGPLGQVQTA